MRVGFYLCSPFHHAMLDPVRHELDGRADCLRTADADALVRFDPQVVVLAEHQRDHLRARLPHAAIVWTRHGLASKNYAAQAVRSCDFACLSSPWVRDDYTARGWQPRRDTWMTGFAPMDALYRAAAQAPAQRFATLLYAPTYNRMLGSMELLGKYWGPELRRAIPSLRLMLKPHPNSYHDSPAWLARYRRWADEDRGIRLVDDGDADIYPLLAQADVLLTDASSVMFYFLALDRPLVLVDNPMRFEDGVRFDAQGYEWQWRDMGSRIERVDQLIDNADGGAALFQRLGHVPAAVVHLAVEQYVEVFRSAFDARPRGRVTDRDVARRNSRSDKLAHVRGAVVPDLVPREARVRRGCEPSRIRRDLLEVVEDGIRRNRVVRQQQVPAQHDLANALVVGQAEQT